MTTTDNKAEIKHGMNSLGNKLILVGCDVCSLYCATTDNKKRAKIERIQAKLKKMNAEIEAMSTVISKL